jgi:16S rRNA (adenine1518-N6/adenine1519-N6)-dimethyltransferase
MQAKKQYGQNFLSDPDILAMIVDFAGVDVGDTVFEIGPGHGALTEVLLARGAEVTALEIDEDLHALLKHKFTNNKELQLVTGDILQISLADLITKPPVKVVANIPYYITAPIIRTLVTKKELFESITLLVQKEVALRLAGVSGNRSVLTIMAQYYAEVTMGPEINKIYFDPVPKVDSALVTLIPKREFQQDFDKIFFRFVKQGFAARRKTLLNNLVAAQLIEKKPGEVLLLSLGFTVHTRPQELLAEDWLTLFQQVQDL